MIQNTLEENNLAKVTLHKCVKRAKGLRRVLENMKLSEQEKPTKTPQTFYKIESFSDQIRKAS